MRSLSACAWPLLPLADVATKWLNISAQGRAKRRSRSAALGHRSPESSVTLDAKHNADVSACLLPARTSDSTFLRRTHSAKTLVSIHSLLINDHQSIASCLIT